MSISIHIPVAVAIVFLVLAVWTCLGLLVFRVIARCTEDDVINGPSVLGLYCTAVIGPVAWCTYAYYAYIEHRRKKSPPPCPGDYYRHKPGWI